jgi:phosphoglycolate phosphatase
VTANRLVLWDIDHTLIETGGVGDEVFRIAFERVTGRAVEEPADVTGRTERTIFAETLERYGLTDPGDYFPKFAQALAEEYRARADEMRKRGRILPGARRALEALRLIPEITQSVLTDDPRRSARIKLAIFQLDTLLDLDIGAYGDDDPISANLVGVARQRATARTGRTFTAETTILIGDTTGEVEAALTGGAHIIAIASGKTTPRQLRYAGAQTILTDLTDTTALIQAISS